MKTILCFGDSNTWGFMPQSEEPVVSENRYPWDVRWPGVLQSLLGDGYRVIENGLNGRTTFFDDPIKEFRNGADAIDICMLMNMPVDLLIIMLGVNDVKEHFHASPFLIGCGLEKIVTKAKLGEYGPHGGAPEILVISPAALLDTIEDTWLAREFDLTSVEKSRRLKEVYQKVAERNGCYFMDASEYIKPSPLDALHLDDAACKELAGAVFDAVKTIL